MIQLRPRLLSAVLSLVLPLAAASCAEPFTPPPPGPVLFEVESINFAWGRHWGGFVVDADGKVYAYDLSKTDLMPQQGDEFTAAELETKYARERRLVATVSAAEVASRYAAVGGTLAGRLSAPHGVCADAGITRFTALLYDASTGRYRRILLHQRGNVARTNTAPAARELYQWLAEVTQAESTGCEPSTE